MIFYSERRWRKWLFRGVAVLVLGTIVVLSLNFTYGLLTDARPPAQINVNYYYNNIGNAKVIALTFDDGPSPDRTAKIMQILKDAKVPATFFFMGSHALRYPKLVQQAAAQGFEIGNHTFTHSQTVHSSDWRLRWELNLTDTVIESITHQPIRLYRPPFLLDIGSDPTTIFPGSRHQLSWAVQNGYVVVGADVDPKDWVANSPQEVVDTFMKRLDATNGHLVLLHDGSSERYTVAALPEIIRQLRDRGYTFATASQLLGLDAPKTMVINRNLAFGATDTKTDSSVTSLQQFLIMEGFPVTDQGGVFGASTKQAITIWQANHGVRAEAGEVGTATRLAISQRIATSMYQPLPASRYPDALLFSLMTKLYILVAPVLVQTVFWIVRIVLLLVIIRLTLTLIMRGVAAIDTRRAQRPWTQGVSVIIPAYNEEDNIGATVTSVLNSTLENLQILIMNDGSKDKTAQIVHAIEKQHPDKVKLYNLKNGGKARALNYGLQLAKHEIVVTMDGDTIFDRYTVDRMARHFNDPSVGAVAGKVCTTRSKNLLNVFQSIEYVISQNMDKQALNIVNAIGVVPGPVGVWRKSLVLAAGGFSIDTMVEDQDLTLAMLANGHRVIYEPQAYAYSETPFRIKDFVKQRSRWIFGTVQCLWKYKSYLFSFRRPALGWLVLPNTLFFSIVLSLLIPLMDILLFIALIVGFARSAFILYLIFATADFAYAGLAFLHERTKFSQLLILPLQRLFYRVIIALVVWKSVIKSIEGAQPKWNKVRKRGDARAFHLHMLREGVVQPTTIEHQKS